MLNLDFIRSQFPGLETDWVLFDNAGGSQILRSVIDRINEHFLTSNVQLGGSYPHSLLAEERHRDAHLTLAKWINAGNPEELIMGSSTSLLIRTLADNFRRIWKQGDEVIVTNCDHEANIGPWRKLEDYGITVREWRVNPDTYDLNMEDLKNIISPNTKLVAFTAASNVIGKINPVKEITQFVHSHGAMVCVDAVAYMPHRLIDVRDTNVDFLVFSFYKTYGPHYAMMYGKKVILDTLPGNNHFFINESPYKFQPGNYNYEFCYGMGALPGYLISLADVNLYKGINSFRNKLEFAYDQIAMHEEDLCEKLISYLNNRNDIKIIGPRVSDHKTRVPTISFIKHKADSESIVKKTDRMKVAIRWGDFYARRLIDDLGYSANNKGVVRVSMVHYNTPGEVDRLLEALDQSL